MMHVHISAERVVKACDAILTGIVTIEAAYPQEDADLEAKVASGQVQAYYRDGERQRISNGRRPTREKKKLITLIRAFALASNTGDVLMDLEEFARIAEHVPQD